jgi:hypothetical protein
MHISKIVLLGLAALLVVQALTLLFFGQPAICECGYTKLWESVVESSGNSQHLTDWYTFSHIIHGFIFYAVLWYFLPRLSFAQRLVLALGVEVAWEVLENTPYVINLYRQQALAQGYTGDSILNSVSDSLAMIAGFVLARKLPVWSIVGLALVMELSVGYLIRDNLSLNILNFIYVPESLKAWQGGAL